MAECKHKDKLVRAVLKGPLELDVCEFGKATVGDSKIGKPEVAETN